MERAQLLEKVKSELKVESLSHLTDEKIGELVEILSKYTPEQMKEILGFVYQNSSCAMNTIGNVTDKIIEAGSKSNSDFMQTAQSVIDGLKELQKKDGISDELINTCIDKQIEILKMMQENVREERTWLVQIGKLAVGAVGFAVASAIGFFIRRRIKG